MDGGDAGAAHVGVGAEERSRTSTGTNLDEETFVLSSFERKAGISKWLMRQAKVGWVGE